MTKHQLSPGNHFSEGEPPMRMPHLELIYRIVAVMGPDSTSIPNTPNAGVSRLILPITGGSVRGPTIRGEIVRYSGADWAQRISSPKPLTKLNARYTLRTDDGHSVLVNATGTFTGGPDQKKQSRHAGAPMTVTQDDAEYFTHITFEASGGSPYEWLNSVVAIGVMAMFEGKPIIDCYRLTNFPSRGLAHL